MSKVKLLYGLTAYGIADPIGTDVTVDEKLKDTLIKAGLVEVVNRFSVPPQKIGYVEESTTQPQPTLINTPKKQKVKK